MMEDSFTRKDLLRMELKVLSCLKFELHYANPAHLLCLLAQVGRCTLEVSPREWPREPRSRSFP